MTGGRIPIRRLLAVAPILFFLSIAPLSVCAQEAPDEIVLCGWDEVYILRFEGPDDQDPRKVWSWRADSRSGLPDSMWGRFATTDECKPVEGGRRIVITSSSDGVAVVERATGRATFWATAHNAHSAEILPGNLLAVAASHRPGGDGDRLIIYDLDRPGRELASDDLPWGHGVVWDSARELLFALADEDIRIYKLVYSNGGEVSLARTVLIALPEGGGHDLHPVPNSDFLSVSTGSRCRLFDRESFSFSPHPILADSSRVKSIAVHPVSGRISWTRADPDHWWTDRVRLRNPSGDLVRPGERLYKARWVNPE